MKRTPSPQKCSHISRSGKPCRYVAISPNHPFCKHHGPPPPTDSPEALSLLSDLIKKEADGFATTGDVKTVLCVVFYALLEGKITERRAGILTYIANTILTSQRAFFQNMKLMDDLRLLDGSNAGERLGSATDCVPLRLRDYEALDAGKPASNARPGAPSTSASGGGSLDPCFSSVRQLQNHGPEGPPRQAPASDKAAATQTNSEEMCGNWECSVNES